MVYKIKIRENHKDALVLLNSIGEVFYDGDFLIFGTDVREDKLREMLKKRCGRFDLESHVVFLTKAMLDGEINLNEAWSFSSTPKAPDATFSDLPPNVQANLKDIKSAVSWLTAFLLGLGLQTLKLRKIQSSLDKFVKSP